MEKRQHQRHIANLEALLKNSQGFKSAGCIKDYSSGGVLLELNLPLTPAEQRALASGSELQLLFFAAQGPQAIPVVVAHQSRQLLGLRFTQATRNQLACLATAAQTQEQHTSAALPAATQVSTADAEAALASALATLHDFMDDHLTHFFELADNALLTAAEQQRTQTEQQLLFDAMLQLRAQQSPIRQQVLDTLGKAMEQPAALAIISAQPRVSTNAQSLSLVGKEAFEDWLLVRVAISRAELQWRDDLIALQVRLDAGYSLRHGRHCPNPFAPSAICHALHAAITPLQLPHEALRIIYECLQAHLLSRLQPLYKQLNQGFAGAGLLPDLDPTQYLADQALREQRQTSDRATTPPAEDTATSAGDSERPQQAVVPQLQLINRLQQSRRSPHDPQASEPPQVNASTLDNLLKLQQQLAQTQSPQLNEQDLHSLIQQHAPELSGNSADTIELVEELFTNLTHNQHIQPELQAQLRKLQLPVLRQLLSDPALLDQAQHPLRKTINHLAVLADSQSMNAEQNRTAVTQAVQSILGNPEADSFRTVDTALERLVHREQRLTERNLGRLRDRCEGQQRLQQANQAIESALLAVLPSAAPQPLLDLLEYGWKALMRLTWLREGAESPAWSMCIKAASQLGDSVRETPLTEQPLAAKDVLKLVRIGLSKVPDELGRHAHLLEDIALLLNEPDAFPRSRYQAPILDSELRAARLQALAEGATDQRHWLQRARKLKPGQWFEVNRGPFQHQPAQIIWQSADMTRLLLANRQGTRSLTLELDEIAQMLCDGRMTSRPEFSQQPVEQGLDALVQKVYARLALDASQDPLTNLLTRREFIQRLEKVVNTCASLGQEYTLTFINLLQFKLINNSCGYAAGDRLLRELSERIRSMLPTDALAGRVGADQFALLLPVSPDDGGLALAQALKQALEAERFQHGDDRFVINTAVTLLGFNNPSHSAMELLRSLETSAGLAKQGGRTKVQRVRPGDEQLEALDEVMQWMTRINRALDADQLQLICQRIQPLTGNTQLPHFEILLRVLDEHGQAMPPAAFIEVAETYHRMNAVDRWVIEHVLEWMLCNEGLLARFGGFSINLSGHSLNDDSFLEFLFSALSRYPVPRDKLIFEITETTAVANLEEAADFINELRGIGCRFSLDDFGAGQSSYTYLKRLPVDYLKIDGAFIRDITRNPVDYALARSITEMGHHLNKRVIAEYVANSATLQAVTDIGVDYAQGYHYGLPLKLDDLAQALQSTTRNA
ncbi:MAG: DUF1631 family protein [Pseudomonadaceae bacterium]|nr:MAG: DUF1631 family protein [Pseudomonadaceae bacterium]